MWSLLGSILLVLSLIRQLVFWYVFGRSTEQNLMNNFLYFMTIPEISLSQSKSLMLFTDVSQSVFTILLIIGVIILLRILEERYFNIVKTSRDSLVFLYSLYFKKVENLEEAKNLKEILKLLRADEDLILDFYRVFDMNEYFYIKNQKIKD